MEKMLTDMAVKLNMAMFNFVNDLKTIDKQYWTPIVDDYECRVDKIIAEVINNLNIKQGGKKC